MERLFQIRWHVQEARNLRYPPIVFQNATADLFSKLFLVLLHNLFTRLALRLL